MGGRLVFRSAARRGAKRSANRNPPILSRIGSEGKREFLLSNGRSSVADEAFFGRVGNALLLTGNGPSFASGPTSHPLSQNRFFGRFPHESERTFAFPRLVNLANGRSLEKNSKRRKKTSLSSRLFGSESG